MLAIINVLLLFLGCFMETTAILLIVTPTLLPIITAVGIDPVHFGIIMALNALKRVNAIRRLFACRTCTDHEGMRRHIRKHLRLLDLFAGDRMTDAEVLMQRHLARSPKVRLG